MPTLLQKIRLIIEAQTSAPPEVASLLARKLSDELTRSALTAGPGRMEKLPDEIWDYFRSVPGEVQTFLISAFCLAVCKSAELMKGMTHDDIIRKVESTAEHFGVAPPDMMKHDAKPPVEGTLPVFKFTKP